MKIKVKTTKDQRQDIEDQLARWENGIEEAKKKCEEEIALCQKRAKEWGEFWANNELGIYNWRADSQRSRVSDDKLFETQTIYKDTGQIVITTLTTMSKWVCKYCEKEPVTKYINVGSHRDYDYETCDCAGAKKNGRPYCELL